MSFSDPEKASRFYPQNHEALQFLRDTQRIDAATPEPRTMILRLTAVLTASGSSDTSVREAENIGAETTKSQQVKIMLSTSLAAFTAIGFSQSFGVFQARYGRQEAVTQGVVGQNELTQRALISAIGSMGNGGIVGVFAMLYYPHLPRIGRYFKWLCLVGTASITLGLATAAASHSAWHLLASQGILIGLGTGILSHALGPILPEYFPKHAGLAQGGMYAAASLGGMTFSFATTALLDRLGIRATLGVLAGFSLVSLSIASALAQPPRIFEKRNTHVVTWGVFTEPLFLCLCAVNLIYPLTAAAPTAFGPSFAQALGVDTTRASYLLAINSGVAIPSRLGAGALGDKIGHLNTLVVATFFYALTMWALWLSSALANNLGLYLAMTVCYGLTNGVVNTVMNTVQKHLFGHEMYYPKSGVMTTIRGIGYVFGVPIVGALVTRVTDDKLKGTDYVNAIVYVAVLNVSQQAPSPPTTSTTVLEEAMSLTPSNSRMMSPALGPGIKLNPSPSPFFKNAPLRSPVKPNRTEASLALRQVVGTTASSANAFDSLPSARCFAYTAGAAAVIATVDDEHHVSQRFFRARPTTNPVNPSSSIYGGPSTPTQNESRNRTAASLRDAGFGGSPLASPAAIEWTDSPSSRAWTMKEKIKAATCVSFSPDGKFLAVGETGYKPRVLIFSTARDAPSDTPLTSLADHTFGVNCLAFSPDSRYLASLGYVNDGFLYIWSINSRTGAASLYASNKCVNHINRMAWIGNKLVTVGTRYVKVWKIDEPNATIRISKARQSDLSFLTGPAYKTLPGRNCILDSLKEATFTSVVSVSTDKAIVVSEKGDVCLLDDSGSDQRLLKLFEAGFAVSSVAVDAKQRLHLASSQGGLKTFYIRDIIRNLDPLLSLPTRIESPTISVADRNQIGAIACLPDYVVTVDSQRAIRLSHLCAVDDETVVGDVVHTLPAHGFSVHGVAAVLSQPNALDASYYTWAADGTVLFWNTDGSFKDTIHVALEQVEGPDSASNELKTVRASVDASFLVTGDKYGILRIVDCTSKSSGFDFKAHAGEITSISIYEEEPLAFIACASRDRTVQIFSRKAKTWELLQTLDEHVGAVNASLFSRNGKRLVSSSGDRSIVVRELVSREIQDGDTIRAFVMLRAIMLKSSPVSITWDVDQDDILLVSTIDRQVLKYDIRSGHCLSSFRACDTDGGDAVVLSSLVHIPRGWSSPLIAGVSSTDKSIRIYEENGTLIARDWGHTEGVSDIALIQTSIPEANRSSEKSLVTVAVDGTIFIWDLALQTPNRHDLSRSMDLLNLDTPSNHELLANKPPLRRVFSQSELARFQRSPEDNSTIPAVDQSPKLRKRVSKFTLAQTPKLEPSPLPNSTREGRVGGWQGTGTLRRNKNRSPSPPSPRNPQVAKRRASMDVRPRVKAPVNEFGSLGSSTESLCRTLRAYRKRLAGSADTMKAELAREVERELATTARAIGDRVKSKAFDETIMVKLLDQYSERLVTMLDERIAASMAQHVRENSIDNLSEEAESPIAVSSLQRDRVGSDGGLRAHVTDHSPATTLAEEKAETVEAS